MLLPRGRTVVTTLRFLRWWRYSIFMHSCFDVASQQGYLFTWNLHMTKSSGHAIVKQHRFNIDSTSHWYDVDSMAPINKTRMTLVSRYGVIRVLSNVSVHLSFYPFHKWLQFGSPFGVAGVVAGVLPSDNTVMAVWILWLLLWAKLKGFDNGDGDSLSSSVNSSSTSPGGVLYSINAQKKNIADKNFPTRTTASKLLLICWLS